MSAYASDFYKQLSIEIRQQVKENKMALKQSPEFKGFIVQTVML